MTHPHRLSMKAFLDGLSGRNVRPRDTALFLQHRMACEASLRAARVYGSGTGTTATGHQRSTARHSHSRSTRCRALKPHSGVMPGPVDDLRRRCRRTSAVPCGSTSCRRLDRNPTASAPCARSRTNRAPVLSPPRQLQASCRAGRRPLNARSPPPNPVEQGQGPRDFSAAPISS